MATRQQSAQTTKQALQERGAEATRQLRRALDIPTSSSDTAILGTALAEAVVPELRRNPALAREIHRLYDELKSLGGTTTKKTQLEPLVPLRHTGGSLDPTRAPDPNVLMYVYGNNKLERALQEYGLEKLKQAADAVQRVHPDTKPTSRTKKDAVIAYIVAHSPYDASWTP